MKNILLQCAKKPYVSQQNKICWINMRTAQCKSAAIFLTRNFHHIIVKRYINVIVVFQDITMIDEQMIREVKNRLVQAFDPDSIYIFGSYAWGHPDEESDLDLLVVVDELKKDRFRAMSDGYAALRGLSLFKDILVYSKKEFEQSALDTATLCNRIKREGKKIYARA